MSETTNQTNVPNAKKLFLNLAAWYAIIVPAGFLICILLSMEMKISLRVPPWLAASLFASSFVVGLLLSMFGRSLGVVIRVLVFVGILVNAAFCGLLALVAWYLGGLLVR